MKPELAFLLVAGPILTVMLILAVFARLAPRLSRPELFFGVTVRPEFRNSTDALPILATYQRSISLWSLVALVLLTLVGLLHRSLSFWPILLPAGLVIELLGVFDAYGRARRLTLPFHVECSTEREAGLSPRHLAVPGGWLVQAGPFVITALVAGFLWLRWDQIPMRYPIHWGADGRANGWASKSLAGVFLWPGLGAGCSLFLALLFGSIARNARRVHTSGKAGQQEARNFKQLLLIGLATEYWLVIWFGAIALLPLFLNPGGWAVHMGITAAIGGQILCLVFVGGILKLAIRNGQGGWRMAGAQSTPQGSAPVADRTRDEFWKYGLFYCNPDDPAIWVEKRFGYGWTVNLGNPGGKRILISIFACVAVMGLVGLWFWLAN